MVFSVDHWTRRTLYFSKFTPANIMVLQRHNEGYTSRSNWPSTVPVVFTGYANSPVATLTARVLPPRRDAEWGRTERRRRYRTHRDNTRGEYFEPAKLAAERTIVINIKIIAIVIIIIVVLCVLETDSRQRTVIVTRREISR